MRRAFEILRDAIASRHRFPMRLSILSVLGEAFVLWRRHWGFFVLLAMFLGASSFIESDSSRPDDFNTWNIVRGVANFVLPTIFQAIGMAAFLSLVAYPSSEKSWLVMARGVHRYTGQLVGVQVLLLLVGVLLMIPFGGVYLLLHQSLGLSLVVILLGELVFLLFFKYALTNPLVVAENMKAVEALRLSWTMTRNRFGFVFGCYLLVGLMEALLDRGVVLLGGWVWSSWHLDIGSWLGFVTQFIGTFWYALPWVMYLRIKAADSPIAVPHDPDVFRSILLEPPEGA